MKCSACETGQLRAGAHTEACRKKADELTHEKAPLREFVRVLAARTAFGVLDVERAQKAQKR